MSPAAVLRLESGSIRRILVKAPTWVGDAVMATPALRALRAAHPEARITVEGRAPLEGLFQGLPSFDDFLVDPGRGSMAWFRRIQNLKSRGFELAVLLPDSPRSAIGPFFARIPHRVGFARDPLRRALLTDCLEHPQLEGRRAIVSTLERYLEITRQLGCTDRGRELELAVVPDATERVARTLAQNGIAEGDNLLVVTPGASFGASKLWPTQHFAAACDRIERELGLVPILAPGPGESDTARRIAEQMVERHIQLDDRAATLEHLKALIARSSLVLSNDTGPRHIAVALGRPVVVLMGPTNPAHTAVHLERQRVLRHEVACSPCQLKTCPIDHRCMINLQPDRVVEAAHQLLENP